MSKLLTISIAAYNVSEYIETTLQSLVTSKYIDLLEIIVVNDGSKDNTLEIIEKYEMDYPGSVIVIDKENGGYGTTVNASIEKATGKYFRILDGDDWVDTNEFDRFIEKLSKTDTDLILTNYTKVYDGINNSELVIISNIEPNKIKSLSLCDQLRGIGIWSITYRLEILKSSGVTLPERIPYTDMLFSTLPMIKVDKVIYYPLSVYQYRLGRNGQSVSIDSRIKSIDVSNSLTISLIDFFETSAKGSRNALYIRNRIIDYTIWSFKSILLNKNDPNLRNKAYDFDEEIKNRSEIIYQGIFSNTVSKKFSLIIFFLRSSNYRLVSLLKFIKFEG